jgi:hypothetical protein
LQTAEFLAALLFGLCLLVQSKSFACVLHPAANQSLVIHARGVSWPWPGPSPLDFWEPSDLSDWTISTSNKFPVATLSEKEKGFSHQSLERSKKKK